MHSEASALDCPGVSTTLPDDCSGTSGAADVCVVDGAGNLTCDLKYNGDNGSAHLYAISDTSADDLTVWGQDGDGNVFCCDDLMVQSNGTCGLVGTSYHDAMKLHYIPDGTTVVYNLMRQCVLYGEGGSDVLHGSQEEFLSDEIYGGDGDDLIKGFDGGDLISAQDGDDTVFAGLGDDSVSGGDGSDIVHGEAGHNVLQGDAGADVLWGGDEVDEIEGGDQDDRIRSGAGADLVWGGLGDDAIDSDEGSDTVYGGSGDDRICTGPANDEAYGEAGSDTIFDSSGFFDTVDGGSDLTDVCSSGDHESNPRCEVEVYACPW